MVWQFCFFAPWTAFAQLWLLLEKSETQSPGRLALDRARMNGGKGGGAESCALLGVLRADRTIDSAILAIQLFQNISMIVAIYGVFVIFFATRALLEGYQPLKKVLAIHAFFLISTLQSSGYLALCRGKWLPGFLSMARVGRVGGQTWSFHCSSLSRVPHAPRPNRPPTMSGTRPICRRYLQLRACWTCPARPLGGHMCGLV